MYYYGEPGSHGGLHGGSHGGLYSGLHDGSDRGSRVKIQHKVLLLQPYVGWRISFPQTDPHIPQNEKEGSWGT